MHGVARVKKRWQREKERGEKKVGKKFRGKKDWLGKGEE